MKYFVNKETMVQLKGLGATTDDCILVEEVPEVPMTHSEQVREAHSAMDLRLRDLFNELYGEPEGTFDFEIL